MASELERELATRAWSDRSGRHPVGIHPEALRYWVRRDEAGHPPAEPTQSAPASADAGRVAELERENRELRRANEILKLASAFREGNVRHEALC